MSLSRLGKLRFAHKVKISFSQLAPHSPLAAFLLSYADLSGQVCFKQARCAVGQIRVQFCVVQLSTSGICDTLSEVRGGEHAALPGCAHLLAAVLVSSHHHAGDSSSLLAVLGDLALTLHCPTSQSVSQAGRSAVLHLPEHGPLLL